jgi:hypothetical protein
MMTDATVSQAAPAREGPVALAVALLDRRWPAGPPLADAVGASNAGSDAATVLDTDPRYIIGRLQQALTILLATDLPPMDSMTSLLSAALRDAIAWRQHKERPCEDCDQSLCDRCDADWDQADRYHALARALGATGDVPRPQQDATML